MLREGVTVGSRGSRGLCAGEVAGGAVVVVFTDCCPTRSTGFVWRSTRSSQRRRTRQRMA